MSLSCLLQCCVCLNTHVKVRSNGLEEHPMSKVGAAPRSYPMSRSQGRPRGTNTPCQGPEAAAKRSYPMSKARNVAREGTHQPGKSSGCTLLEQPASPMSR